MTYTEFRYLDVDSPKEYDEIMKQATYQYIPEEVLKYFRISEFTNNLDNDGSGNASPSGTIYINDLITYLNQLNPTTPTTPPSVVEYASRNDYYVETDPTKKFGMLNTILNINPTLKTYYESIGANLEVQNPNNEYHVQYMIGVAKLIVEYFIYSTILYAYIHRNGITVDTNIIININYTGTPNTIPLTISPDADALIQNLVAAIFDITKELNTKNETFHNLATDNIRYNDTYTKNNDLLKDKDSVFNDKKTNLITMMSKNDKIKNNYSNKSFWYMIYLILLIIYILTLVAISYMGTSNLEMFNTIEKTNMGMVVIIISSLVLIGVLGMSIFNTFF